jgi:hypothetical protein
MHQWQHKCGVLQLRFRMTAKTSNGQRRFIGRNLVGEAVEVFATVDGGEDEQ